MRPVSLVLASSLLATVALPIASAAQSSGFKPGSRELFALDMAGVPVGEFPKQLKVMKGAMTVVEKDGMHMLRASDPAEFLIPLPELMPRDFTLEFDVVPKLSGNPWDLTFEGTPTINQGEASMHVMWQPAHLMTVGGGEGSQLKMPEDLAAAIPSMLTEIRASIDGTTLKLYTNGQMVLNLVNRKFVRSRVLRVFLGGQDDDKYAVYLAKIRVATNSPKP
jgi:hypothetical protein